MVAERIVGCGARWVARAAARRGECLLDGSHRDQKLKQGVTEEVAPKETAMQKQVDWLCAAMAAIVAVSLSLPLMSMAQAQQRAEGTLMNRHWGYNYSAPYWAQQPLNPTVRNPAAYHGHFALPEFDPNYHGSNGG
jgi:hypothetical protein